MTGLRASAAESGSERVSLGCVVFCRYKDHRFFQNSDASKQTPQVLNAVGRLDFENNEFIHLIWEEYTEPNSSGETRVLSTGLVILKSTIVEIREASRPHSISRKRLA